MDFKRMWMHLDEEVKEEAAEWRDFFLLDTLLANMESFEQFDADGKDVAWGTIKGRIEELQSTGDSVDIEDLLELMDDIEYSQLKTLFDEEDSEPEAKE